MALLSDSGAEPIIIRSRFGLQFLRPAEAYQAYYQKCRGGDAIAPT
jgi:hypothetical protein